MLAPAHQLPGRPRLLKWAPSSGRRGYSWAAAERGALGRHCLCPEHMCAVCQDCPTTQGTSEAIVGGSAAVKYSEGWSAVTRGQSPAALASLVGAAVQSPLGTTTICRQGTAYAAEEQ